MSSFRLAIGLGVITLIVQPQGAPRAQTYPEKPIRMIVTGIGGGVDFAARLITPPLSVSLGQQVIVDNRPSGTIPGEVVSRAAPDGYTVLFTSGSLWVGPFLQSKVPYDPVKDFLPVTLAARAPNVLVVHPSLPVKSVRELIGLAKSRPGDLNYASSGASGGTTHLAAELFKALAGVNILRVSYRATGPALNALLGGEVQLTFAPAASATQYVKSGRLRALGVSSAEPSVLAPGLPTISSSGVPGYELVSIFGILAPARTSTGIIVRLNQEIVRILAGADVKEKLLNTGVEAVGSSPEQFRTAIASEMSRLGKVIRDAGIREE